MRRKCYTAIHYNDFQGRKSFPKFSQVLPSVTNDSIISSQVKDVVGYDILGHCYFTEDGPEERNTFDHCLGLMVRAGTLLPSDRDGKMCRDIKEGAYPGYVPNPRQDCRYVCFPIRD